MDSPNFTIEYKSDLITTATHLYSGTKIITDAPLDNFGKASAFSPTDLVSSMLASCMISVIAIHFKNNQRDLLPVSASVKKIMASSPRRIGEIHIEFNFGENKFSVEEFALIERLAHHCPVAKSLHSEIKIVTQFN